MLYSIIILFSQIIFSVSVISGVLSFVTSDVCVGVSPSYLYLFDLEFIYVLILSLVKLQGISYAKLANLPPIIGLC
jgi:hypothetical protein